jgi:hypothetical protein
MGDNDRVARRGAGSGLKAEALQVLHEPIGGALAVLRKGWIGRDGGDAQQGFEPFKAGVEALVNLGEDGVERTGVHHR